MRLMKKLLLSTVGLIALVVVVSAGVSVASNRYHDHQKQKQAQAVVYVPKSYADQQVTNVKTAAAGEYQSLVVQYNGQVAECQKGLVAYGKLTPAQKAQTAAPSCGAQR